MRLEEDATKPDLGPTGTNLCGEPAEGAKAAYARQLEKDDYTHIPNA